MQPPKLVRLDATVSGRLVAQPFQIGVAVASTAAQAGRLTPPLTIRPAPSRIRCSTRARPAKPRAALREELALVHERLTAIEQRIALLPDLHFLYASPVAQQVVQALRKAEAKPTSASWCRPEIQAGCDGRREGADHVLADLTSCLLPRRLRLCCRPAVGDDGLARRGREPPPRCANVGRTFSPLSASGQPMQYLAAGGLRSRSKMAAP
jgi:hypothetical protein